MRELVQFVLLCVVAFCVLFTCGQLYVRGNLGRKRAAIAGGLLGLATSDWTARLRAERGAVIGATSALVVAGAITLGGW